MTHQKVRVFELAKELKLTSKELMGELEKMRIQVKSHMSVLEDETVAYIKRHWGEDEIPEDAMVPGMTQMAPRPAEAVAAPVPAAVEPAPIETPAPSRPEPVYVPEPEPLYEPEPEPEPVKAPAPVAVAAPPKAKEDLPPLRLPSTVNVGEVAERLGVKPAEVIKKLMGLGVFATINQRLDQDTIEILLSEYGYQPEYEEIYGEDLLAQEEVADRPEDLQPRPPVVTIMGHVNHGKTSLLDAIRETNVMDGEAGGITQHIGAYQVKLPKGYVTFLDTPGHEAFTTLRARGAQVTDVVVLVVAADDGVQPQTIEAIDHAKAANVPIIVAVNKIDKPGADPSRVRQELTKYNLVSEEWGGKTIFVEISAKKRIGLEKMLEMILLEAEMLELKANRKAHAKGTVIEAKLDRGRGPVATVLVQRGTLNVGDPVVTGVQFGRVRALMNERGAALKSVGPGMPAEVLGLSGVPTAGDLFQVLASDKLARQIAMKRQMIKREQDLSNSHKINLDNLRDQIKEGTIKELKIIIKADVQGSAEVLANSLEGLSTEKVRLTSIHSAVGNITERDILLATASNAIVLGFNVKAEAGVDKVAQSEQVDVRIYSVIYDVVEDVKAAMEGLLEPHYHEVPIGQAEVRNVFKLSSGVTAAGSQVTSGKITRGAQAKVVRRGQILHTGKIESLKRFKDDAKEVPAGMECGLSVSGFKAYEPGDVIEAFVLEAVAQKL
ncbi:MAG: translation initiation factor IF-2 [candidate division FCPU426 bacterium]